MFTLFGDHEAMRSKPGDILTRLSTGVTAFVMAGFLVHAIFTNNGGNANSQTRWQEAKSSTVDITKVESQQTTKGETKSVLDDILTSGIERARRLEQAETASDSPSADGLSVMDIIRKNSDIAPSVSSGTNRISVTVKKGDTLYGIAKRHGWKGSGLAGLNGLDEPYVIKIGQTLYIAR